MGVSGVAAGTEPVGPFDADAGIEESISPAQESAAAPSIGILTALHPEYVKLKTYPDISIGTLTARPQAMRFYRYVELFFTHLYPIMPVLDPNIYLYSNLLRGPSPLTSEEYSLLSALSAITIVQLNLSAASDERSLLVLQPEALVRECLQERARNDSYLNKPTTTTIITSFFLFGYYGNMEVHGKSRYYLQEAITFAEMINLDDEGVNAELSQSEIQWRRRLFWLLFITER
jgi:hypothetical protein